MKIAYLTAGAGGMFCGSCLRDNTLAAALIAQGHDAVLIPTYTPIRTDEESVAQPRVFLGGINVYLQQKWPLFRYTPRFVDRLFDWPPLLKWVSRFAVSTRAEQLGELTLSMLRGEHGHQKKEVVELVQWLSRDVRPDVVVLSNVLISGLVPKLCREWPRPIVGTLQGDDIFLEALPTSIRREAKRLIRENCAVLAGYLTTSRYYADFMAEYLDLPRERIAVVYPGINLQGHGIAAAPPGVNASTAALPAASVDGRPTPSAPSSRPFAIGYFARICPQKGLHLLIEAFRLLKKSPGLPACRLRVAGWLAAEHRGYFDEQKRRLADDRLLSDFEHHDCPDLASKVRFLQGCDVLSVPTVYREPKGLYLLEAWANAVPVVQPRHGAFPELIAATGGGLLVPPGDPVALADGLRRLLTNPSEARELGRRGQAAVRERFHAAVMARETVQVLQGFLEAERSGAMAHAAAESAKQLAG
ncbi:MAG: glycosyltransferase family 4 protein [Gemmataceae bacterium]|nr:glycosyltransferase family 4 protein [Gemmataceae bacterium]